MAASALASPECYTLIHLTPSQREHALRTITLSWTAEGSDEQRAWLHAEGVTNSPEQPWVKDRSEGWGFDAWALVRRDDLGEVPDFLSYVAT